MIEKIIRVHKEFLKQDDLLFAVAESKRLLEKIGFGQAEEVAEYGGKAEIFYNREYSSSVVKWSIGKSEYTVRYNCTVRADDVEYTGEGVHPDAPLPLKSFYIALDREGFYTKYDTEKVMNYDNQLKKMQWAYTMLKTEPFRLEIKTEWTVYNDDC